MAATCLAKFKSAQWSSPAEAEAFLLQAGAVDADTLSKILDLLAAKGAPSDAPLHRQRCKVFASLVEHSTKDTSLFVPFVRALKGADPVLRAALATVIPKVNNFLEHGELCNSLNSSETALRATVAPLIVQLGGKTVSQILKGALRDKNFHGRTEAIDILVRIGGHHALPTLQEILAGGKPAEKLLALKYLGDPKFMGKETSNALRAIATALDDPSEQIALQAISSFGSMCSEDDWFDVLLPVLESPRVTLVRTAVESLKRFSSPRVFMVLERKLRLGPNAVRFSALSVLEGIGTNEVLTPLVDALSHKQLVVRNRAGEVLSRLSKANKLDLSRTIVYLLKSLNVNVRRMAIELARTVKDPNNELWPKLLVVLRDEDWWVRERVVDVLVEMAGQQLTRHIVSYLNDSSDIVRRYAVDVLIRLKDPAALGALVRTASADSDWWVKEKALEAMAALKDARSIPYIVDLMQRDPDLRWACIRSLSQMAAQPWAAQVATHLTDPSVDIRLIALSCLQKLNDPSCGPAVQALTSDPEISVRNLAREICSHWSVVLSAEAGVIKEKVSPLEQLLTAVATQEADDLVLTSGRRPMMKRLGTMIPMTKNTLTAEQVRSLIIPKLSALQIKELDELRDVDFSYEVKSEGLRFRANIFTEVGGLAAVFRIIKGKLPEIEKLGLPELVIKLGSLKNGLVLIGGPTGSGKSTTLAALVNYINRNSARHIISLEDPIEVIHPSIKSLVNQREIGVHTHSFPSALRATLREDPNVILVGELRDLPTISFAVTAAETGHLVFGTVHTVSTDTTVDRMINAFPTRQQEQVRSMLSESLRAICCQYLLRQKDGVSRCLALEILINNDAIAALIRKGKAFQIPSVLSTSRELGMQLMDTDLMRLYKEGKVSAEEVYVKARSKAEFEALLTQSAASGVASPTLEAAPIKAA